MPKLSLTSFLDQLSLAFQGLFFLATKKPYRLRFWLSFALLFLFFGALLNLLGAGLSSFRLLFSGDFSLALSVLSSAFLGIFGVGKAFPDWLLNFALTLLQATLLSLVLFLFRQQKTSAKKSSVRTPSAEPSSADSSSSGLESSALVTGLVILGSGCPTCGTTLLAPLLTAFASGASGSLALAGKLSFLFNCLAFLLGIFAFRRLGLVTYATIKSSHQPKRKNKKP